ncbi:hypothetical protein SGRI78S_00997 [Streptomyces griseus subsp. griseus]
MSLEGSTAPGTGVAETEGLQGTAGHLRHVRDDDLGLDPSLVLLRLLGRRKVLLLLVAHSAPHPESDCLSLFSCSGFAFLARSACFSRSSSMRVWIS